MLRAWHVLPLGPPSGRAPRVVLASPLSAMRLRDEEGYEALSPREGLWHFDGSTPAPSPWELRRFVATARISGISLPDLEDWQVLRLVRQAISCSDLLVMRPADERPRPTDATADMRKLIRQIENRSRGRLAYAGRHHKLVGDVDLPHLPGRDDYEVVGRDEAARVLAAMAHLSPEGELPDLLRQASHKLSPDWRPPFRPDGLVLLRRIPVRAAVGINHEPAITPSQMKKLLTGWVELVVVWDDTGEPVTGLPLAVETAGNRQSVKTGGDGRIRITDVEGTCEASSTAEGVTIDRCVTVAGFGPAPVAPASRRRGGGDGDGDGGDAAPLAIAAIDAHRVRGGETLASIAAQAGIPWQELAKFNWGTDSPREINERLRDEVGCTKKTADGRNYILDDTDTPGIIYIPREWAASFEPGRTHTIRVRRPKGVLLVLENEEGLRLPEVDYHVVFDNGTVRTGRLGRNGMALVSAPSSGSFAVTYPDEIDMLAKSLAASVRKGFDDRRTDQVFRLFAHDRAIVVRAVAAYDRYFNDYTGGGLVEDLYQEFTEPEALAVCEALMGLHGLPTRAGVRVTAPSDMESVDDG